MRECVRYAKARKGVVGGVFGSMFLLGISGSILLPHLMWQWSYDRRIGSLHMILGTGCLCGGLILLCLFFRKLIPGRAAFWKSSAVYVGIPYLLLQLGMSCIMGGMSWGIAKGTGWDQEQIKWQIYLLSGFFQNIIRVGFIYILVERFYGRNWKEDAYTEKRAIAVFTGLCAIMTLPALLPSGDLQSVVTVLCQSSFLTGLIAWFGNYAWGKKADEEKE